MGLGDEAFVGGSPRRSRRGASISNARPALVGGQSGQRGTLEGRRAPIAEA